MMKTPEIFLGCFFDASRISAHIPPKIGYTITKIH